MASRLHLYVKSIQHKEEHHMQNPMNFTLKCTVIAFMLSNCSGANFGDKGSSPKTAAAGVDGAPAENRGSEPGTNPSPGPSSTPQGEAAKTEAPKAEPALKTNLNSDEQSALNACLEDWGTTPFSDSQTKTPRKLRVVARDLSDQKVVDVNRTEKPELVLVILSADTLSNLEVRLGNKQGWYCLYSTARTLSSITVATACGAKVNSNELTAHGLSGVRIESECGQ